MSTTVIPSAFAAKELLPATMLAVRGSLTDTVKTLRSLDPQGLASHVDAVCDRVEAVEPQLRSLLPEARRRERLQQEMAELARRYPETASRPPLFGAMLGVKDILKAADHPTRCGSALPPELFADMEENTAVTRAKAAGALVLGKTVTTEFACSEPGSTTNPWNPNHTPGGSSQGSAASLAAGLCQLSLGSQTGGSVNRPGAFCGITSFKATHGRIPANGCVMISNTLDHVGLFAPDVESMRLAAETIVNDWQTDAPPPPAAPGLGVPSGGSYLDKVDAAALADFERTVAALEEAGVQVKRVPLLDDVDELSWAHLSVMRYEAAVANPGVHGTNGWWRDYAGLYRARTAELITKGLHTSEEDYAAGLAQRETLRTTLASTAAEHCIDFWLTPGAPGECATLACSRAFADARDACPQAPRPAA